MSAAWSKTCNASGTKTIPQEKNRGISTELASDLNQIRELTEKDKEQAPEADH